MKMGMEEVAEIFNFVAELDTSKLDFTEQLYLMTAMHEFAEKMKPIAMKYAMREHTKSTFLMRLGDED